MCMYVNKTISFHIGVYHKTLVSASFILSLSGFSMRERFTFSFVLQKLGMLSISLQSHSVKKLIMSRQFWKKLKQFSKNRSFLCTQTKQSLFFCDMYTCLHYCIHSCNWESVHTYMCCIHMTQWMWAAGLSGPFLILPRHPLFVSESFPLLLHTMKDGYYDRWHPRDTFMSHLQ